MNTLGTVLRLLVVCLIFGFMYRTLVLTERNHGQRIISNGSVGVKPTILAAPTRTIKNTYFASVAVYSHNSRLNALAIQFAESVRQNTPMWGNIISIGDAYSRGKYPFLLPNETMALACYRVAACCPCSRTAATAQSRVQEVATNPVQADDTRGKPMSTQYGHFACNTATRYMSQNRPPPNRVSLKIRAIPRPLPVHPIQQIATNTTRSNRTPQGTRGRRVARRDQNLTGGSQNTHDHGVVTATKANIKQLKGEHGEKGFREHRMVVDDAMNICRYAVDDPQSSGVSDSTYHDMYEVVTSLTNDEFSDTGLTQIQILDLVLDKIRTLDDTTAAGARETLCKRIASAVEDGRTVCATGKISRIVSVFEGVIETTQKAVSIGLVEKEISHMATKVRDDFLDKVGPVGREAYESTQSVPQYATSMANILKERVTEEYVHKLGMSPSIIEPLIDVYSNAF